jgi:hypothetical protein
MNKFDRREKARELFWAPVNEQLGVLVSLIEDGEYSFDEVYNNLEAFIDRSIFGNRLKSPPIKNTLKMVLRQHFGRYSEKEMLKFWEDRKNF